MKYTGPHLSGDLDLKQQHLVVASAPAAADSPERETRIKEMTGIETSLVFCRHPRQCTSKRFKYDTH